MWPLSQCARLAENEIGSRHRRQDGATDGEFREAGGPTGTCVLLAVR